MSSIAKLLGKMFGNQECRGLFLGLDASGRTTTLYKLKLGEVVTTIPTIGFNVETVPYYKHNFTMWDVGGCDKIRPLWRHYYQNTQFVWFFVDSNDRDRIGEVRDELHRLLSEPELEECIVVLICNKQDLPNAMSVKEVEQKVDWSVIQKNYICTSFGTCATSGDGIFEALQWTARSLDSKPSKSQSKPKKEERNKTEGEDKKEKTTEEKNADKFLEWLEIEDEPTDEFIHTVESKTLTDWGHRTHLRIAWAYLTKFGRREGMKKIFSSIQAIIKQGTIARRTFHETMTYFWAHMVHYAIEATKNPTKNFVGFLLMNPQFFNSGMFLEYYTKKTMLEDMASRQGVVLPDIKPLPSIISDTSKKSDTSAVKSLKAKKSLDDDEFLEKFLQVKLDRWDHTCFLRAIWVLLKKHGLDNKQKILDSVQAYLKSGFSVTVTGFWIAMIASKSKSGYKGTFAAFYASNPELADTNLINKYYSETLMDRTFTIKTLAFPDKQGIPGFLEMDDGSGFLKDFQNLALDSWKHEYLIKAIFFFLKKKGRREGVKQIFSSVEKHQGKGFHFTITYFWIQMVDYTSSKLGDVSFVTLWSKSKPLHNEHLYLKYYSKKFIYSDNAAKEMMLPDIKQLPSIVMKR